MSDEKKPTNLVPIAGGGTPDKLAEANRELRAILDHVIEYEGIQAKIKYARFKALIKARFSEAQAMEICKAQS